MKLTLNRNEARFVRKLAQMAIENDGHFKIESDGFYPLTVEVYNRNHSMYQVCIMQTYVQNGDLMRSPETTFLLPRNMMEVEYPAVWILTYQDDSWGHFSEVYNPEEKTFRPRSYRDAKQFLPIWFKNIKWQFSNQLKKLAA